MNGQASETQRRQLWSLLGDVPPRPLHVEGALQRSERVESIIAERWRLGAGDGEAIPALVTRPAAGPPRGVVLYQHAHGHRFEIGKEELLDGRPSLQRPAYGHALAERGWAAVAIDHRGFGESAQATERMLVKRHLWLGATLLGFRIHDSMATVTWLQSRSEFAGKPLVAFGMSMGSTLAWWSAALDTRVDAVVEMCCLAEFDALLDSGGYDLHAEYFFVPGLAAKHSAASINALIAPRPHLSLAGRDDPLTPPAGLESLDRGLRDAYERAGAPHAWRQSVHDVGHQETAAMRAEVLDFIERQSM